MKKLTKTISIEEAVKLSENGKFLDGLLKIIPDELGINLCSVKDITIKCTDDEYGQLTDLQISFIPGTGYEAVKAHGGMVPRQWLKRSKDNSKVEIVED